MHMSPIGLRLAPAARLPPGAREQHRLEHAIAEHVGQRPAQSGCRRALYVERDRRARDADRPSNRSVGSAAGMLQPQDLSDTSHRHSLGWHRVLLVETRRPAALTSGRAITTSQGGRLHLGAVADIKSESVAEFISESLADIARNQHAWAGARSHRCVSASKCGFGASAPPELPG